MSLLQMKTKDVFGLEESLQEDLDGELDESIGGQALRLAGDWYNMRLMLERWEAHSTALGEYLPPHLLGPLNATRTMLGLKEDH
jgi:hypothetical protein